MRWENLILFQSDDKAWAARLKKKDDEAAIKLERQLEEGRKKHPPAKVVVYNPQEPDVPPVPGTVAVKPVKQVGSSAVAHISEALDKKQDGEG